MLVRGIARDHPFVDGNKRTAYEVADVPLRLNGYEMDAERDEVVQMTVEIARGNVGFEGIVGWLRATMKKR